MICANVGQRIFTVCNISSHIDRIYGNACQFIICCRRKAEGFIRTGHSIYCAAVCYGNTVAISHGAVRAVIDGNYKLLDERKTECRILCQIQSNIGICREICGRIHAVFRGFIIYIARFRRNVHSMRSCRQNRHGRAVIGLPVHSNLCEIGVICNGKCIDFCQFDGFAAGCVFLADRDTNRVTVILIPRFFHSHRIGYRKRIVCVYGIGQIRKNRLAVYICCSRIGIGFRLCGICRR